MAEAVPAGIHAIPAGAVGTQNLISDRVSLGRGEQHRVGELLLLAMG
jgi:hypothetical protein